jgi:anaerobic selenocysteine-containing dehydrogenase
MLVQVEDGRATRLRGDPNHPVTQGFLCGKVAQYLEREYSPERLLYPQKRAKSPKAASNGSRGMKLSTSSRPS